MIKYTLTENTTHDLCLMGFNDNFKKACPICFNNLDNQFWYCDTCLIAAHTRCILRDKYGNGVDICIDCDTSGL